MSMRKLNRKTLDYLDAAQREGFELLALSHGKHWRGVFEARDRRNASLHEAAHAVVALHYGIPGFAEVFATDTEDALNEKTYVGRFGYLAGLFIDPFEVRQIAVAGAVGVNLFSRDLRRELDFADWEFSEIHEAMSASDCKLADFPERDDDMCFADTSEDFATAATLVEELLSDKLRMEWLKLAKALRAHSYIETAVTLASLTAKEARHV